MPYRHFPKIMRLTRKCLPSILCIRYVPLFLDAKDYLWDNAWHILMRAIEDDKAVEDCLPLFNWL
jgi:hypothetical protein